MAPNHATRHTSLIVVVVVTLAAAWGSMTVSTRDGAAGAELQAGDPVSFATPPFLQSGKRYAFTWPGGGPPQTYTVRSIRRDGWISVEVAEDNTNPAFYVAGQLPVMWLHVGMAISIQEMRPLQ
jgi:hypothetical protein